MDFIFVNLPIFILMLSSARFLQGCLALNSHHVYLHTHLWACHCVKPPLEPRLLWEGFSAT